MSGSKRFHTEQKLRDFIKKQRAIDHSTSAQQIPWTREDETLAEPSLPLIRPDPSGLKRLWRRCPHDFPKCYMISTEQDCEMFEYDARFDRTWVLTTCADMGEFLVIAGPVRPHDARHSVCPYSPELDVSNVMIDPATLYPSFLCGKYNYGITLTNDEQYSKEFALPPEIMGLGVYHMTDAELDEYNGPKFKPRRILLDMNMGKYYIISSHIVVIDHMMKIETILDIDNSPSGFVIFVGGNRGGDRLAVITCTSLCIYDNRTGKKVSAYRGCSFLDGLVLYKSDLIFTLSDDACTFFDFDAQPLRRFCLVNYTDINNPIHLFPRRDSTHIRIDPKTGLCYVFSNKKLYEWDISMESFALWSNQIPIVSNGWIYDMVFYPFTPDWIPWTPSLQDQETLSKVRPFLRCGLMGRERGSIPPQNHANPLRLLPLDALYVLTEFLVNELQ